MADRQIDTDRQKDRAPERHRPAKQRIDRKRQTGRQKAGKTEKQIDQQTDKQVYCTHKHTDKKTKTQAQGQYCDKLKREINTSKLKEMFELVTSALAGDQTMKTRLSNFQQQGGHCAVYFLGADCMFT